MKNQMWQEWVKTGKKGMNEKNMKGMNEDGKRNEWKDTKGKVKERIWERMKRWEREM